MKKRITALLIALGMICSMLPVPVWATEGELAGDGTPESPYHIADAADLIAFAERVNDGESTACAELSNNIDMTGEEWVPIGGGWDTPYSGTFDGKYFTVTLGITADDGWEYEFVGMFGNLENATVQNVKAEGSIEVTADCQSYPSVGGIAAYVGAESTFKGCKNAVSVTVEDDTELNGNGVGGIAGMMDDAASFEQCTNWGNITVGNNAYSMGVGGIAGYSGSSVDISYCYNYADIEYYDDTMGGLIGNCSDITAVGCYSAASAEPHNAPKGLKGKTLSGNDFGDLFGAASYEMERMLIYCDQFGAYDNIGSGNFEETQISRANCMTALDMAAYLNGNDGEIYTVKDGYAGGWPVLAWELKTPTVVTNPEEAAYAKAQTNFSAKKASALNVLDNGIDSYKGYNWYKQNAQSLQYSKSGIAAIDDIYKAAKAELNAADLPAYTELEGKTAEEITAYAESEIAKLMPIAERALQEMKAVPTKAQETQFAADKKDAAGKLERVYIQEVKRLNALRGDAAAVWHDLNGDVSEKLADKSEVLDATRTKWTDALNACTNKTALDSTLQSGTDALSAILQGYTVSVDSGVKERWDGHSVAQPSGSGTKADPYRIGSAAELAWFSERVNSGSRGVCAVLTADIDLNGKAWTPIGNGGVNGGYTGSFDGKEHIIHGICVEAGEQNRPQGLFGTVSRAGTVRNVKAAGRILAVQGGGSGLIAGRSDGTICNCEASVFLQNGYNVEKAGSSVGYIGGIAGYMTAGYVENCRTWGLFQAYPESYYQGDRNKPVNSSRSFGIGGIVGSVGGSQEKDGCLVRYCENRLQIDSFNYSGTLQTLQGYNIGGIVGSAGIAKVRECLNDAAITGSEDVGGIVGAAAPGEGNSFSAAYVENRGDVNGAAATGGGKGTGGILGRAGSTTRSGGTEKYVGNVSVEYAYNSGSVSAVSSGTGAECAGAIVGVWLSGSVSHARSSSANDLWGTVKTITTRNEDTAKAVSVVSPVHAGNGTDTKLSATQTLLRRLIHFDAKRDSNYAVYGEQSTLFNAVIMQYVRRIEEAKDSAVDGVLADAAVALAEVPTQLQAEKNALLSDMRDYVTARIYDADVKTAADGLLEDAAQAIENAVTVEAVANLRQQYMGTENIDGKLAELRTYPAKAAEELYNLFIFGKKYTQDDMAKTLRAYEEWKVKLDNADDFDGVEAIYADARNAMNELVKSLAVGEAVPDMEQAAADALNLMRQDILDQLGVLETEYADKLTALAGDMDTLSDKWQARLTNLLESDKALLHTLATPELNTIDDYGKLMKKLTFGRQSMANAYAKLASELNVLTKSARNKNAWDGNCAEPEKINGIYRIGTAEELAWLAAEINENSNNSADFSAVLTADIDLGYRSWTPIGFYADWRNSHPYRGTFDGQGHTVSGLYITETNNGYAGLFGYTSGSTVIKNLTVTGEICLENCTGTVTVGSIVGEANADLESCVSLVQVAAGGFGVRSDSAVGGLAGRLSGSMTDCRFEGSVKINCQSGGAYIAGGVGGVVGAVKGGKLTKCVNAGAVVADKGVGVGGVAGIADGNAAFVQCANSKAVSNDVNAVIGGADTPKGGAGGILGAVKNSYNAVSLESCYNTGTVSGSYIVGGILGGEGSGGNDRLTVKNCYNAGALDVGTRTDRIGSLAGYPMKGQYCEGLYVLAGSARLANGWISSQGDSITSAKTLTAAGMPEIYGLVDSIADLNGGYPLFDWQLEKAEARQAVIAYLNEYFEAYVKAGVTDAQQEALTAQLKDAAEAVMCADKAQDIISAYNAMMSAMNINTLVQAAKASAAKELKNMKQAAAEKYPAIEKELDELLQKQQEAVNRCRIGSQIQQQVNAFAAGVVDLLIADAQGAKLQELSAKLETVERAYAALSDAQKSMVTLYGRLYAMQTLLAQYEENADQLKAWYEKDSEQYSYISKAVKSLYDDAAVKLGACSNKTGIDTVMNGYMAGLAQTLVEDIAYKSGQTSASMVKKTENRLKNAQELCSSMTAEQKDLIPHKTLAALQGAQALLEAYNSGMTDLKTRSEHNKKAYPNITDALEGLANQALDTMGNCVDADGIKEALNRYDTDVKALQADSKDDRTTESGAVTADTVNKDSANETDASVAEPEQTEQTEHEQTEQTESEDKTSSGKSQTEETGKLSRAEKPNRSFDWSIVWMAVGILVAIGVIFLLWRWFVAAKQSRRRDGK